MGGKAKIITQEMMDHPLSKLADKRHISLRDLAISLGFGATTFYDIIEGHSVQATTKYKLREMGIEIPNAVVTHRNYWADEVKKLEAFAKDHNEKYPIRLGDWVLVGKKRYTVEEYDGMCISKSQTV